MAMASSGWQSRGITTSVAPVHTGLVSVSELVDQGRHIVSDDTSYLKHGETGEVLYMTGRRDVPETDFELKIPGGFSTCL